MDPSQVLGDSEDCGNNESSWTMYIGSPLQSSNHEHGRADDASTFIHGQDYGNHFKADVDDESDDSMTSDASSGPNRQKKKPGTGYFGDVDHSKHQNKSFSGKKTQRQMKQRDRDGRTLETPQELVLKANSAASHVRSVNKVRKSR